MTYTQFGTICEKIDLIRSIANDRGEYTTPYAWYKGEQVSLSYITTELIGLLIKHDLSTERMAQRLTFMGILNRYYKQTKG